MYKTTGLGRYSFASRLNKTAFYPKVVVAVEWGHVRRGGERWFWAFAALCIHALFGANSSVPS